MAFNNTSNKAVLRGFVNTDITSNTEYSLEFEIGIPRKTELSEQTTVDYFTVYVNKPNVMRFCKQNLKQGMGVIVRGEIRNFYKTNSLKICSDDIRISLKSEKP